MTSLSLPSWVVTTTTNGKCGTLKTRVWPPKCPSFKIMNAFKCSKYVSHYTWNSPFTKIRINLYYYTLPNTYIHNSIYKCKYANIIFNISQWQSLILYLCTDIHNFDCIYCSRNNSLKISVVLNYEIPYSCSDHKWCTTHLNRGKHCLGWRTTNLNKGKIFLGWCTSLNKGKKILRWCTIIWTKEKKNSRMYKKSA